MARVFLLAGLIGVCAVAGVALAQSGGTPPPPAPPVTAMPGAPQEAAPRPGANAEQKKQVMAVTASKVEVRSGPGEGFYATSELLRGQGVIVLRESARNKGWLEIEPPQHSFSWVNARFVKKTSEREGMVYADQASPAPILAGSRVVDAEPSVEVAKAERGTLLAILGPEIHSKKGTGAWIPVQPLSTEVRYIPASAVGPASGLQVVSAQGASFGGFNGTPAYNGNAHAAKMQADQLLEQARKLYEQAANDQTLDAAQRQQAWNTLQALRGQGAGAPGHPANAAAPQGPAQGQLVSGGQQKPGQTQSLYSNNPQGGPQWTSWGTLKRTQIKTDGQPTYVLVNERGTPIVYAVSEPGKTLDPYLNRTIALYGRIGYRSDESLRNHVITVSYVSPPQ